MAVCPFMSKSSKPDDWSGCMISCGLYIKGYCSLNVIAQKIIHDAKKDGELNSKILDLQTKGHNNSND